MMFRFYNWLVIASLTQHYVQIGGAYGEKECVNPNGRLGQCLSIRQCAPLNYVLRHAMRENFGFVRSSQCQLGKGEPPYVCCTTDSHFTDPIADYRQRVVFRDNSTLATTNIEMPSQPAAKVENNEIRKFEKFPKPPNCGALPVLSRIYGGEATALTEFSWMVNLEYRTASGAIISECSGSLINERYVLTAAHCVRGAVEHKVGKLISLRLGEHNIHTEIDCNENGCLPPAQHIGIEQILVHEHYEDKQDLNINQHNDIALLRMDRTVNFTDFIQPVCLPHVDTIPLQELHSGMYLTVAGWGHNSTVSHTSEKHKVNLPLVDLQQCRDSYEHRIYIAEEQLCAGGEFRKDSCTGDSGGPLMRLSRANWMLEGITSFGFRCGIEHKPGVYTRIRSYLHWIEEHIQAW